jgi:NAD(P)-dependent dehydrogenase (short-subunit alcohol dehydrogenase family)
MCETVLITGASGLLGRALVREFAGRGLMVLAQYHRHPGREGGNVRWLAGDFSGAAGTKSFLRRHAKALAGCNCVVHNYGPIAEKATAEVTGADLLAAFQAQLQPALDITRHILAQATLRSALFIAFEDTGRVRPFRKVLAFAMAKNALPLLSRSLADAHPGVRFNVLSPPTLAGAAIRHPRVKPIAPEKVAARACRIVLGRGTGRHYRWPDGGGRCTRRKRHGSR